MGRFGECLCKLEPLHSVWTLVAGPSCRINQQVAHPFFPRKSDGLDDLACRLSQSAVTRQPITAVTLQNFKMFWRFHVFLCGCRARPEWRGVEDIEMQTG